MIAVVQWRSRLWQQAGEPFLALDQRPGGEILAVEIGLARVERRYGLGTAGYLRVQSSIPLSKIGLRVSIGAVECQDELLFDALPGN